MEYYDESVLLDLVATIERPVKVNFEIMMPQEESSFCMC